MYMVAAAHFGIGLRCLLEDDRRSRALQASIVSCLADAALDSSAQCPWTGPTLENPLKSAFDDMALELAVLASVNVSHTVRQCSWKASDPVVFIRLG